MVSQKATIGRVTAVLLAAVLIAAGGPACSQQYRVSCAVLSEGVVVERASAREGTLSQVAHDVEDGGQYREGWQCLLVSGRVRNTTTATLDVYLWVDGYDADGDRVASTLSTGTQKGYLHVDVPPESARDFEIAVSWSGQTRNLKLSASSDDGFAPAGYMKDQVLSLPIVPEPGATLVEGVVLEDASTRVGILEKGGFDVPTGRHLAKGDWCLLVSGRIRNTTAETLDVDVWIDGYDSEGERVASTVASDTREGFAQFDVAAGSSLNFEIAVSWSNEVRSLRIFADVGDSLMPLPAVPPSASPSGPISVSPPVGAYLPSGSKGEPSELLLLAVQVEEAPSSEEHYLHETGVTIQPGDTVLVVTGTLQNRHRAYPHVYMHADGYNAVGEQVAWTLEGAGLPGQAQTYIEPGQVGEFTMHLNAAEDVATIRIFAGVSPIIPP
jgi:hypothetical protein